MIDLLIKNTIAITLDPQRRIFLNAAIAVDGGKIIALGPAGELANRYSARQELDGSGFITLPGLINTHMHLPQVLMRGIYDNIEAMDKLKNYTWPIQGSYDEEDALINTQLGLLEMIKSGTTAFLSTGLHPRYGIDSIIQAIIDSGIRAGVSKYVMDISGYALDNSALHQGMWEKGAQSMSQVQELIGKWNGAAGDRIRIWISPRSVGGCSVELLKEVVQTSRQQSVGITAHWSEVQNNVDYTLATYGLRPAFFAESLGLLGPDVTFAHGIYFDESEIRLLARTQTNIAHCPVCNSKLAMGVAPVPQMLRTGVNVALANDGMGVNNTADILREMRSMALLHRVTASNACFPTAAEALEMATLNGARAMRIQNQAGSLEAGKQADLIMLDARKPHLTPLHDPLSAVVWAANGGDVDTVIIDGKVIMRGRKVLTLDEEDIIARAEARKEKILKQAGVEPQRVWPIIP